MKLVIILIVSAKTLGYFLTLKGSNETFESPRFFFLSLNVDIKIFESHVYVKKNSGDH